MRKYTDEQFADAVKTSITPGEVARKVGIHPNRPNVLRRIKNLNLDCSHFLPFNEAQKILQPMDESLIFCVNSGVGRRTLKDRFLKKVAYRCQMCGNEGIHNGKPLVLAIDHINGVRNDNRLENLRLLCPNCHSQTETFCGANTKRRPLKLSNEDISLIRGLLQEGLSLEKIAHKFAVHPSTIKRVRDGVRCPL